MCIFVKRTVTASAFTGSLTGEGKGTTKRDLPTPEIAAGFNVITSTV